jgi:hypothetical protein
MYALPHVIEWFRNDLKHVKPELSEGRKHELQHGVQSPVEQLDSFFHDFITGGDLEAYEDAHMMFPNEMGVWELKTSDIRLFGWVPERCSFIIANAASAAACKDRGLYAGYRDDTVRRRNSLDLDEPKFLMGGCSYVF